MLLFFRNLFVCCVLATVGCSDVPWNSPYEDKSSLSKVYYDSFSERPKHLDPVSSYSENEARFTAQIYEPVVQYHYLKRPYELVPLTAETMPRAIYFDSQGRELAANASDEEIDRTVYRITIKPGIEFQPHPAFARKDGEYLYHNLTPEQLGEISILSDFEQNSTRELTAADYVYQIKRLAHPGIHSPIGGLMGKYIAQFSAFTEMLNRNGSEDGLFLDLRKFDFSGVAQIDRYTYEIVLSQKYPQFIYWLAMPFFSPVPWEADAFYSQKGMKEKNITLDWYPVGTGPYMLVENNPNKRMVLERNPNFRGEKYPDQGEEGDKVAGLLMDSGREMPFIDVAHFSLEKEAIPSWTKFLQGYYDLSGIVSDSFDQAVSLNSQGESQLTSEMADKGIKLVTAVQASIGYMGFNMKDPVVGTQNPSSVYLRRALSIVVDYEELISIFANGRGIPAHGPIPPGIFGHVGGKEGLNPYVYQWREGRPKRRSIEHAKSLIDKAGYRNGIDQKTGKPLTLYFDTVSGGAGSKALITWYRKQFAKLGIQLVVRTTDYNRFQEKIRNGTAQIFRWGWNADYPDPENFLFLLYGPNSKVASQGENAVNYENPEYDRLFVQMRAMSDSPERQLLIDRMVELVRRDCPWIWGYHPTAYMLHHEWYKNTKPNLMARNTLKYKDVDPLKRKEMQIKWNRPVVFPILVLCVCLFLSAIPAWLIYSRRQRASIK